MRSGGDESVWLCYQSLWIGNSLIFCFESRDDYGDSRTSQVSLLSSLPYKQPSVNQRDLCTHTIKIHIMGIEHRQKIREVEHNKINKVYFLVIFPTILNCLVMLYKFSPHTLTLNSSAFLNSMTFSVVISYLLQGLAHLLSISRCYHFQVVHIKTQKDKERILLSTRCS